MEMGIDRIFGTWRCFSKDPGLATRVMIDEASATVAHSNPAHYVLELEKNGYLEDTRTLAMGTALLYSIAFSAAYAFMYMTYGMLWV